METFERDARWVFKSSGLSAVVPPPELSQHRHRTTGDGGGVTGDRDGSGRTREHFSTLGRGEIQSLYEMYSMDFEMFGYSVEEYFKLK